MRGRLSGRQRALASWTVAGALLMCACEDRSYRDIGAAVRVLVQRNDTLVPPAIERLARFGRRAIPQIEIALHTASPTGKANLIRALETMGDHEAVPIFGHFAIYDGEPQVRAACEAVLAKWARASGERTPHGQRGNRARQAIAQVAERRARGEGPVLPREAESSLRPVSQEPR